ncbi:bifunctional sugar phosphate isomerase/epimerase/4-hydroxyphenylpyruvate dioxygenase family protein [Alkalilacustris brevis]|uniref:bifunctional sugar phosphate isomerase/epimerase/4-hydroxyphenylpyruvate dioxygenase family protein n=1 Tax=Alkalilacustris brevis TaxID=2026338 RepID=UPI000E0D6475|nr:sugar phosphate isomerase/epimerase and 4-hydroxyphenylpyruvate domain-containing protein [Alkalilacustris brevis]
MKTAIATVCLSGDLPEKLAAIAAAGFQGIEIFENDFLTFDAPPREVGRMVRDHGLEIALYQPFRDLEGLPGGLRQRAFDRAERKFDLMAELGTNLMLICSNTHPEALGGIDRAAADLHALGEIAAGRGLRLGYEALAWGRHVNDHRDAWEIVRRADHANVGLILDSFHTLARGIDCDSIRAIPGDRIFFVQLADAPRIEMDLLYWSRHFRNMPGQGDLDVTAFMRAVAATGYHDYLSLEIFNDQFRGAAPRSIALDGQRSLRWLMDDVARQEPDIRITPPEMPARIRAEGVEFIEFATDPAEAAALGRVLHTLGFARVGQHLSKQVAHWRQGRAHILINTSEEGFAHSLYLLRGTTVCDVGLRVADAAATVARAQCLGAEVIEQPIGPGELRIPAIRGSGGGLWHFIDAGTGLDRLWEIDFADAPDPDAARPAGVTHVDHVAQTMNFEEMQSWVLFHLSLFEMQKAPLVDVIDPSGLVRSQAVEAPDGALRITLNGADNSRTLAGRFLAESYGPSVQHVALACEDIFAAAAALAENGFAPLGISPNYYDDLEARLDLPQALTDRLRAHNILYDRDAGGEYFQIYSPVLGEGFFFEIVERRGGYRGYGAANAAFRVAAQQRARGPAGMPRR